MADLVFHFGQSRVIAVSRTRSRVHESLYARVASGDKHIEKPGCISCVCLKRIAYRSWHGAKGRLVQHDIRRFTNLATRGEVDDVSLEELMSGPFRFANRDTRFVEVVPIAGRKIVDTDDVLLEVQQRFDEMRTDESCTACD